MLASPLLPGPSFLEDRDGTQYRPVKDIEAFKQLLPPPIEFLEGSSSGMLAIGEGKYQPINGTPKLSQYEPHDTRKAPPSTPTPSLQTSQTQGPLTSVKSLYNRRIDTSWPQGASMGCGLNNTGNTCFLNSALQCLLHTPPLLNILLAHGQSDTCRVKKGAFCMACSMRTLAYECYKKSTSITPYVVSTHLSLIAKQMRRGRQEDSHEFLRYAIDALQRSCLAGYSPKIDHKLAETTWVHKIFGGRLRSRVTCLSCGYNSDTFDSFLDLSVDIFQMSSLKEALRKFVAVDHLRGADKYKCDKCKKPVAADKQFTVHEAPVILSIHLKRFSPMGRKIGQPISYDEKLSLQPVMSEGHHGPTYTLYGVISHAGGGPNSGHYYAHIKNSSGQWFEMNDDAVLRHHGAPTSMRNAYVLFYMRDKGQALEAAVSAPSKPLSMPQRNGLVAGMKKRKVPDGDLKDDAKDKRSNVPFIGPRLPSPPPAPSISEPDAKKQKPNPSDPQANLLKKKIAAASSRSPVSALQSLAQYGDDDDSSDVGETVEMKADTKVDKEKAEAAPQVPPNTPTPITPKASSSELAAPPSSSPISSPARATTVFTPIPASSFYGSSSKPKGKEKGSIDDKKRKSLGDGDDDASLKQWARTPLNPKSPFAGSGPKYQSGGNRFNGANPYSSRLKGSDNLRERRNPNSSPDVRHPLKRKRGFAI